MVDTEVTLLMSVAVETTGSGAGLTGDFTGVDTLEVLGVLFGVDFGVVFGVPLGVDLGLGVFLGSDFEEEDFEPRLLGSRFPSFGDPLGEFNPIFRGSVWDLGPGEAEPVFGFRPGPGDAAFFFFKVPDLDAGLEAGLGLDFPETVRKTRIFLYSTQPHYPR